MNRSWKHVALSTAAALALLAGCDSMKHKDSDAQKMDASGDKTATATLKTAEAASTRPAWGKPTGTVTFTQSGEDKVKVAYDLKGLTPGKHGFHIHDKADLSAPDLSSAGPHFNPTKHKHAGRTPPNATPAISATSRRTARATPREPRPSKGSPSAAARPTTSSASRSSFTRRRTT